MALYVHISPVIIQDDFPKHYHKHCKPKKCDLHNLDRGAGHTASIRRQCDEMHLRHFTYIRHLHLYWIKTNEGWIKHHIFVV